MYSIYVLNQPIPNGYCYFFLRSVLFNMLQQGNFDYIFNIQRIYIISILVSATRVKILGGLNIQITMNFNF